MIHLYPRVIGGSRATPFYTYTYRRLYSNAGGFSGGGNTRILLPKLHIVLLLLLLLLTTATTTTALNGDANKLRIQPKNKSWRALEVISFGDTHPITNYKIPGQMDGIGAYLNDTTDIIRIFCNHELYTKTRCDNIGLASVTEIVVDKTKLKEAIANIIESAQQNNDTPDVPAFVTDFGLAYDKAVDANGNIQNAINDPRRFCSGQLHMPFGNDDGFVDVLYIFGEEEGNGRLFAIDTNRTIYQLSGAAGDASPIQGGFPGMKFDHFENAARIRTYETKHVALVLSADFVDRTVSFYVGQKNKNKQGENVTVDDNNNDMLLVRNGLAFGSWFYLEGSLPTVLHVPLVGSFGTNRTNAISADKLEDVDTSPNEPTKVVLAESLSGIYILDFTLIFSDEDGRFLASNSSFTITRIAANQDPITFPDNLDWTTSDTIFVNSDWCTNNIWKMNVDGTDITPIAETIPATEATGILDISNLVDYPPDTVLLVNSMGDCESSSMALLINANAAAEQRTNNKCRLPCVTELFGWDGYSAHLSVGLINWCWNVCVVDLLARALLKVGWLCGNCCNDWLIE